MPLARVPPPNQATGATTNQDGFYALPYLQPSDYDVEVSANGFRKMKKENVSLLVAQKLDLIPREQ